jgi:hypothetical protein
MGCGPYWYVIHVLTLSNYAIFFNDLQFVTYKIVHILHVDDEGNITAHKLVCDDLKYDLPGGKKIELLWNAIGQPVGQAAGLLGVFLGELAANAEKLPINYDRWPNVSDKHKNPIWDTIKVYKL